MSIEDNYQYALREKVKKDDAVLISKILIKSNIFHVIQTEAYGGNEEDENWTFKIITSKSLTPQTLYEIEFLVLGIKLTIQDYKEKEILRIKNEGEKNGT